MFIKAKFRARLNCWGLVILVMTVENSDKSLCMFIKLCKLRARLKAHSDLAKEKAKASLMFSGYSLIFFAFTWCEQPYGCNKCFPLIFTVIVCEHYINLSKLPHGSDVAFLFAFSQFE